jgi:uncharacterized iron-regulated membrane protein
MRKWHRWLSILFGIFAIWIATTGLLSHVGEWVNHANERAAPPPPVSPPGFICPESMTCRPKPQPQAWNVGLLHHLHSGESFGEAGEIISFLTGFALLFFAVSGLWMYIQMYRGRGRVGQAKKLRGGRFFW